MPFGLNGEHVTIRLIDFDDVEQNSFVVTQQFISSTHTALTNRACVSTASFAKISAMAAIPALEGSFALARSRAARPVHGTDTGRSNGDFHIKSPRGTKPSRLT